jgi:hypothetical protein
MRLWLPAWGTSVLAFVAGSGLIRILPRFMTVYLILNVSKVPSFVKCLESLPNLHTLEITRVADYITTSLEKALKPVKLPQIKTLILPPAAHPLLEHCCNVEDVVCVIMSKTISSGEFLRSLASNRNSRVKRLAIPLFLWGNPSRKRFSAL